MIFVKQNCGRVQMEIHSMQMTEIEGRRHRIDDTQVKSKRKKETNTNTNTNTNEKIQTHSRHEIRGVR